MALQQARAPSDSPVLLHGLHLQLTIVLLQRRAAKRCVLEAERTGLGLLAGLRRTGCQTTICTLQMCVVGGARAADDALLIPILQCRRETCTEPSAASIAVPPASGQVS